MTVRDLFAIAATLQRALADGERDLIGTVTRPAPEIADPLARLIGRRVKVLIREADDPARTFLLRRSRTADLLVTSWPPGAEVRVNGKVRIALSLKGHRPTEIEAVPEQRGDRPHLVEGVLEPVSGR